MSEIFHTFWMIFTLFFCIIHICGKVCGKGGKLSVMKCTILSRELHHFSGHSPFQGSGKQRDIFSIFNEKSLYLFEKV